MFEARFYLFHCCGILDLYSMAFVIYYLVFFIQNVW